MKTTMMLGGFLVVGAALFSVPRDARAAITDGLGTWEGTGNVRSGRGADMGRFDVVLVRKAVGGRIRADGKVTLANGQVIVIWQEIEDLGADGYRSRSSNGVGAGRCFSTGMCQSYEDRGDGHSFATTIVTDGPTKVRVLVTELDKGQAVRFIEQTLTKKP